MSQTISVVRGSVRLAICEYLKLGVTQPGTRDMREFSIAPRRFCQVYINSASSRLVRAQGIGKGALHDVEIPKPCNFIDSLLFLHVSPLVVLRWTSSQSHGRVPGAEPQFLSRQFQTQPEAHHGWPLPRRWRAENLQCWDDLSDYGDHRSACPVAVGI